MQYRRQEHRLKTKAFSGPSPKKEPSDCGQISNSKSTNVNLKPPKRFISVAKSSLEELKPANHKETRSQSCGSTSRSISLVPNAPGIAVEPTSQTPGIWQRALIVGGRLFMNPSWLAINEAHSRCNLLLCSLRLRKAIHLTANSLSNISVHRIVKMVHVDLADINKSLATLRPK